MSWCSATGIMDAAVAAAEAAVGNVLDKGAGTARDVEQCVDEALRPFVATIAEMLRDGDWDCIDESRYYNRFAQEMRGENDREYETRLVEGLHEAHETDRAHWLELLNKHRVKMEASANGAG